MSRKGKILFSVLAIVLLVCLFVFSWFSNGEVKRSYFARSVEDITAILGPGFPKAYERVAEMCGEDVQLLGYRPSGYYNGTVYEEDTRLSKDTIVEYSFTQGACAPGHYAVIEVVFDLEKDAITDGPREHALGYDTREPMDEMDLQKIRISIDEAIELSGQRPNRLSKHDGTIIWDMSSFEAEGIQHRVWIHAITGEKIRDEYHRMTL